METEEYTKAWKKAIEGALKFYANNEWDNDSTLYDVIYNGKHYPPKEIYAKAIDFFLDDNPDGHVPTLGGGKPTNKFIRKHGFEVILKNTSGLNRKICKMQMKSDADKRNYADEVLADNRITGHIDFVKERFENLNRGDIVLVHKGSEPHCLVEIVHKIIDKTNIKGESFGIDYSVKILSNYADISGKINFKVGHSGSFQILTNTNSRTYQSILSWLDYLNPKNYMENYIQLLKYKKQIILQGPPGTGKTYTAKKIAEALTGSISQTSNALLTPSLIKSKLIVGQKFDSPSGKPNYYTLNSINDENVELQSENSQPWKPKYTNIIKKYNDLIEGKEPSNKNALDPYEISVAKYIYKNMSVTNIANEENYTIVQFHPSYSYEDFVRGITVKSNTKGEIEYITKNKILAELAEKALESYNDKTSNKIDTELRDWANQKFNEFVDDIQDKLDNQKEIKLTEVASIVSVDLEEKQLRYTGKNWNWSVSKLPFKDIINAYLNGVSSKKELEEQENITSSTKHRSSYAFKTLELFRKSIKEEKPKRKTNAQKEKNINYVLIIDEINRANLPSVLGELIYALEYRGEPVNSIYSIDDSSTIILPENLYIIGTMNTADRSVGHIDYAIKRRFAFVDMLPNVEVINNQKAKELFNLVSELFTEAYLASDFEAKDVHLGHSYFLIDKKSDLNESKQLQLKLDYEILPILNEYVKDGLLLESAKELIKEIASFEC